VTARGVRASLARSLLRYRRRVRTSLHELEYLFWECTLRCDLRCGHCGSDCTRDPGVPDPPLGAFLGVLDDVAGMSDPRRVTVCLTGGEPTLRGDLEDCIREIASRGYPVGMVTNGWSLSEERLGGLAALGLGAVTVSLDGLPYAHDRLRGREGSFDRACGVLRAAMRSPVRTDAVTCVHPGNLSELPGVRDLLLSLGVPRWRLAPVFPRGRASDERYSLDREGLLTMLGFIRNVRADPACRELHASFGCEGYLGPWEGVVRDDPFHCLAGIAIGSVLADGSITGCPSMRGDAVQGSIHRERFAEVWESGFRRMRDRGWARTGPCASCSAWSDCLGGPMHLRSEDGDLHGCPCLTIERGVAGAGLDPARGHSHDGNREEVP